MSTGSNLRVVRQPLLTGARQARGIVVVIDVLRAFSTAAFMIHLGAKEIRLLVEVEEVLRLKQERGYLAVGEVGGRRAPGFDLGNSPSEVLAAGPALLRGRTVLQRSSAGVVGAVAAAGSARELLLGSYLTAGAIARYIRQRAEHPALVTLVSMGDGGQEATPDDESCADYLEHLLTGRPYDHVAVLREIVRHHCVQKFIQGDQAHFPPADPIYCLQRDLFDFVLVAREEQGYLVARPERC